MSDRGKLKVWGSEWSAKRMLSIDYKITSLLA